MLLIHHIRRKDGVEHAKRASTNPLDDTTDQHISPALRKEAQNPPSCEYQQSRKQNRHSPEPIGQYARNRRHCGFRQRKADNHHARLRNAQAECPRHCRHDRQNQRDPHSA